MRIHNTEVVSSIPPCVTIKALFGEESNGKPLHEVNFPRNSQSPVLVSANLETENAAMQNTLLIQLCMAKNSHMTPFRLPL